MGTADEWIACLMLALAVLVPLQETMTVGT